jgi:hypothetical protein
MDGEDASHDTITTKEIRNGQHKGVKASVMISAYLAWPAWRRARQAPFDHRC